MALHNAQMITSHKKFNIDLVEEWLKKRGRYTAGGRGSEEGKLLSGQHIDTKGKTGKHRKHR